MSCPAHGAVDNDLTGLRIENGEHPFRENRPVFAHGSASLPTTHGRQPLLLPAKVTGNSIHNEHAASPSGIVPLPRNRSYMPTVMTVSSGFSVKIDGNALRIRTSIKRSPYRQVIFIPLPINRPGSAIRLKVGMNEFRIAAAGRA